MCLNARYLLVVEPHALGGFLLELLLVLLGSLLLLGSKVLQLVYNLHLAGHCLLSWG
jgi:hypothetical protein